MKHLILVGLLLLTGIANAADSTAAALNRLQKVEHFAFGGVGFAGTTSQGEKDYWVLAADASAMAQFENLYKAGTPEAKLYALVGIRQMNPKRFQQLIAADGTSKAKVTTVSGCIVSGESFAEVVRRISQGNYTPQPPVRRAAK